MGTSNDIISHSKDCKTQQTPPAGVLNINIGGTLHGTTKDATIIILCIVGTPRNFSTLDLLIRVKSVSSFMTRVLA